MARIPVIAGSSSSLAVSYLDRSGKPISLNANLTRETAH